ncbi:Putative metallopeptidase [Reichenbachiella faecimaris]|uniref:Putative metallopeptidase n=1 Tax=Reichenbachiella faecimaris TaxID=692418 RepID=A0A1W2G863_REIFA|nr:Putative metallopeptidase [Reichenbachiella faecimaris]
MIKLCLFVLICCDLCSPVEASKLSIGYQRPESDRFREIFRALKSNHESIYGESVKYLKSIYNWPDKIEVVVSTCGFVNSRYLPNDKLIVICYESLYQKVYDYPEKAKSKEAFERRVFQNVMFTLWHELGHALMDQFGIGQGTDVKQTELLADEFAALSMLWRSDAHWNNILMISALHFKSQSLKNPNKNYKVHASDDFRYEKIIVLLYGFAQKSYSKLKSEVNQLNWLSISAQEYYLERSVFWEQNLREHTRGDFFNN